MEVLNRWYRSWKGIKKRCWDRYKIFRVHQCGFWFVDIPRTSSSSIRVELGRQFGPAYGKRNLMESEYSMDQYFLDHQSAVTMRETLGTKTWNRIFKFSFVRNPWDRFLSLFLYRKKRSHFNDALTFREYLMEFDLNGKESPLFRYHGHYLSMCDFLMDEHGTFLVDYIGRFEQRQQDLQVIGNRINCHRMGTIATQGVGIGAIHYRDAYDSNMKQVFLRHYQRDLDVFKYTF